MSAKILATPINQYISVNDSYAGIAGRTESILRFTHLENIDRFHGIIQDLADFLIGKKAMGDFITSGHTLEETLFSPRENSTPAIRIQLGGYTEAVVHGHTCEHSLNSPFIAMVKKAKKINEEDKDTLPEYYIPTSDGVLRVKGKDRSSLVPRTFMSDHVVIQFDDEGIAREIYRPPYGSFRMEVEGELNRKAVSENITAEWYTSNYLKTLSDGERTWKFTKGDTFYLTDQVAGEEIHRRIGRLFIAKNVATKEKRVIPTTAGVASVLHRTVMAIKEGGGEHPEALLKDIKNFPHIEVRRILMNTVGLEKFLMNAETLDIDIDSGIHRALVLDKDDEQKYLICHDGGTGKQYVLPVPDRTIDRIDITTCAEAGATLSAMSVDQFLTFSVRNTILDIANSDEFKAES